MVHFLLNYAKNAEFRDEVQLATACHCTQGWAKGPYCSKEGQLGQLAAKFRYVIDYFVRLPIAQQIPCGGVDVCAFNLYTFVKSIRFFCLDLFPHSGDDARLELEEYQVIYFQSTRLDDVSCLNVFSWYSGIE